MAGPLQHQLGPHNLVRLHAQVHAHTVPHHLHTTQSHRRHRRHKVQHITHARPLAHAGHAKARLAIRHIVEEGRAAVRRDLHDLVLALHQGRVTQHQVVRSVALTARVHVGDRDGVVDKVPVVHIRRQQRRRGVLQVGLLRPQGQAVLHLPCPDVLRLQLCRHAQHVSGAMRPWIRQ